MELQSWKEHKRYWLTLLTGLSGLHAVPKGLKGYRIYVKYWLCVMRRHKQDVRKARFVAKGDMF